MPLLDEFRSERAVLLREIEEFRAFLTANPRGERADFLPFFTAHSQLCAYLGTMHDRVSVNTHVKAELSLWGDFICDLVAGSVQVAAFVFFEFEDASPTSLFRRRRGRRNSYWGTRVERGISQVTDWLFRISSEGPSDRMERDFGARHIIPMVVVVVGRRSEVSPYDRVRLDWRSAHSVIGGAQRYRRRKAFHSHLRRSSGLVGWSRRLVAEQWRGAVLRPLTISCRTTRKAAIRAAPRFDSPSHCQQLTLIAPPYS